MNADPKTVPHVEISVANLEDAVAFYKKVMGWHMIEHAFVVKEESTTALGKGCINAFGTGWGSFKMVHLSTGDGIGIELFEFKKRVAPQKFECWKTPAFHFCVHEPNIKDLVEKVVAHGGTEQVPIREYYPGEKPSKMAFVKDPFGLVFELFTELPAEHFEACTLTAVS